jgi:dedicated sortase system histidine kinase
MPIRFSIRLQLLVLSLFLFAIPWLGYRYVWELEQYLRIGQEQTMIGTARAVATALHERPALFDSQSAYLQNVRPGTDLYAPPIDVPIQLDGKLKEWDAVSPLIGHYDENNVVTHYTDAPVTLAFDHMVGRYDDYLYSMFAVTDDHLVYRKRNSLSIDRSDHLLIGMLDSQDRLRRFVIAPYESGWVNAYLLDDDPKRFHAIGNELQIQGRWQETAVGYNIELRFPLNMTSGALAFALVDIDDPNTRIKQYTMGTANPNKSEQLGTVVTPSPEIERILSGLKYADSRVWVIDKHQRVLARAGNIQTSTGIKTTTIESNSPPWWHYIEQHWLLPLYYQILTRPPRDFIDDLDDAYALAGKDISSALQGQPDSLWRLTPDNKTVILSAAYPIFIGDSVMGAVVVEQTTNGIRTLRNRALEKLFHVILAVMLLGTLGLLLFAHRISSRIRKLRDDTESVIDSNGKIVGSLTPAKQGDEIGDLSRSFTAVFSRLQQYNSYLENMASRLSHELRTPIAVVRSSLETLGQVTEPDQQQAFIERAQSGINRLSSILNSMSEATRLEHAITQEDKEIFSIVDVVQGCVSGYQQAYGNRYFQLKLSVDNPQILGSPDLIAQMLDKIIANAVEFSLEDSTISLHLWQHNKSIKVSVTNTGPVLPEGMKTQLLQSMVSIRKEGGTTSSVAPHLGLGLYIANMVVNFHKGEISLENLPDNTGVCVVFSLPIEA